MPYIWERARRQNNAYLISLDDETPAKRLQAWRDLMRDRATDIGREVDRDMIRGSILGQAFDGGAIGRWTLSPQTMLRTKALAKTLSDEFFFVSVVLEGRGVIEQGDDAISLEPGDFMVIDGTRPYNVTMAADLNTRGILTVPKSALRQRLGLRQDAALGVYKPDKPLHRLVSSFLTNLNALVGEVERSTLTALVEQSLDMVALLANDRRPGAIEPSTHQSAMLLRLKLDMKANLKNPPYNVEMAAAALRVSTRYVNALLALESTSFGRRLIASRLDEARRQIVDPRNVHRQITEVAFDCGFNNASHFGKVFKDRFGMTPREAKMAGMFGSIGAAA